MAGQLVFMEGMQAHDQHHSHDVVVLPPSNELVTALPERVSATPSFSLLTDSDSRPCSQLGPLTVICCPRFAQPTACVTRTSTRLCVPFAVLQSLFCSRPWSCKRINRHRRHTMTPQQFSKPVDPYIIASCLEHRAAVRGGWSLCLDCCGWKHDAQLWHRRQGLI